MEIGKIIYNSWEKVCRGEFVVLMTSLFSVLIILTLAIRNGGIKLWASYGIIFALFFTRYLTIWIDKQQLKKERKR